VICDLIVRTVYTVLYPYGLLLFLPLHPSSCPGQAGAFLSTSRYAPWWYRMVVPDWTALKFNPLGVYNLRRRLGALSREPGVFMRYKDRFLNSDISWFASGLHNDGQHTTSRDTFHPLFLTAREHTGVGEPANKLRNKLRDSVRDHVFDMVSLMST